MKKSVSAGFLVLVLLFFAPEKSICKEITTYAKSNTDLQEIVLKKDQMVSVPETNAGAFIALDDSQTIEKTLENKSDGAKNDKKGFFSVLNLNGGVEKSSDNGNASTSPKMEASVEKTAVRSWLDGDYATGKWFGARPLLTEHGVTINSSWLYSPYTKTRGGANDDRSTRGYSLFNLGINIDTEKAGLWKGGTFFGLYQRKMGYGLSGPNGDNGAMGDWMGLDGWDWREMNQISEYWYQQKLFDGKVRMKLGKQDGNTDFAFLNSGWDFMNTAFSINPTVPLPTYPDPAFGFMAEINPKEWFSIRDGIYSKFNVPFNITEIEFKPKFKKLPGRYMLGMWEMSDSTGMQVADGLNDDGSSYYRNFNRNFGFYADFEQMVYKENKDDENDMQGLVVFGQFGISPDSKNDMCQYTSGGLEYIGPIPKRDKDRAGVAVGSGRFASRLNYVGFDETNRVGSETVVEAFYRVQVTPWFYLQPDIQYIANPGGTYDSSVAVGIRSVITF